MSGRRVAASDTGLRGWGRRGVDEAGCFFELTAEQAGQGCQRSGDCVFDGGALFGGWFSKDPVRNLGLHAWVSDSDPKSPVVGRSQLGVDVAQSVVSGVAPAAFELDLPG